MKRLLTVRIPATSANLGPGFDSLGLALDLWNTFELHCSTGSDAGSGVQRIAVESHGEGAGRLPEDGSNLIARTMVSELERLADMGRGLWHGRKTAGVRQAAQARRLPHLRIVCRNDVPCASGLGSSSTAVLAGLIFAHALIEPERIACDQPLLIDTVLREAAQLEGHGDNVAPALLGGLIAVSIQGGQVLVRRIPVAPLRVVVCLPGYELLTVDARSVVPRHLPRADAVYNIGRSLLVADALRTGDLALLGKAMGDRIHEPYRFPIIPGAQDARQEALEHGAAAVSLSGAGPGLLAYAQAGHDQIGQAMKAAFARAGLSARCWVLDVSERGTQIEIEE